MPDAGDASRNQSLFQKVSFVLVLAAISAGFLYMIRSFLLTLLMAGVFTGMTHPWYRFFLRRLRRPALASFTTLLIVMLVLVLPMAAAITVAYHEALGLIHSVNFATLPATLERLAQETRDRFPALLTYMSPADVSRFTAQSLHQAVQYTFKQGAGWSVLVAGNVAGFFIMLLMMFYFYMDGERLLRKLIQRSPLRDDYLEVLLQKFLSVSRATLKGILVVGMLQGAIGIVLYSLAGLQSPVFLGVLMVFCSVLPMVGTAAVWVPTAIVLFLEHRTGAGLAVVIVGVLVISTVDNLVRPVLVGKDIKMHDLLVLLSTLGGLGLFGLPGFVMGPVLASLFLSIWTMYEEVFAVDLRRTHAPPPEDPGLPPAPAPAP